MQVETVLEQLFFTTVFIRTIDTNGGIGSGTGFVYTVETGPGQSATFLVTNKHVVREKIEVALRFIAGANPEMTEPVLGQVRHLVVDSPEVHFVGHPDPDVDVAVMPLTPHIGRMSEAGQFVFFRSLTPAIAMTDHSVAELDAIEEVTFIGYPNGLFDASNFLPIARRGTSATPLSVDYAGKPTFLIDASVFPGSSGSPVLLVQRGAYVTRDGGTVIGGGRIMLLGVVAAVYQRQVPVLQDAAHGPPFVHDVLDIGIVYKAKAIDETVDILLNRYGLQRSSAQPEEPVTHPEPETDVIAESEQDADPDS